MSSDGSSYADFVNDLIDEECENTMKFLEGSRKYIKSPENITHRFIRIGSAMVINFAVDAFLNGVSEDDNIRETKLASDFCIAGYRKIFGI